MSGRADSQLRITADSRDLIDEQSTPIRRAIHAAVKNS
jgi:hypothetical protein